jgi:hypothetical protein
MEMLSRTKPALEPQSDRPTPRRSKLTLMTWKHTALLCVSWAVFVAGIAGVAVSTHVEKPLTFASSVVAVWIADVIYRRVKPSQG